MRATPKVLSQRRRDRAALERSMLRVMRKSHESIMDDRAGKLSPQVQARLWGLESARRQLTGKP